MDGCSGFMRCILYMINFLVSLSGIIIVSVGMSATQEIKNTRGDAWTLIVIGIIIIFVAFLGCCGIIYDSRWMSITYAVVLFLLVIITITIGIYIVQNPNIKSEECKGSIDITNNDCSPSEIKRKERLLKHFGIVAISLGVMGLIAVIFSASLSHTFSRNRYENLS